MTHIKLSFIEFIAIGLVPGLIYFLLDGFYINGFLKQEVKIPNPFNDTKITIKFGDLFLEDGWKAIGVNDFFDSKVDEDIVSPRSLHGFVINTYWSDNLQDLEKQLKAGLKKYHGGPENRPKGKKLRYPIGTTIRACTDEQKFLFVALTRTNIENNVTSANAEMLICSIRGLASEARAACSMEPLVIPLMGSSLARIGVKPSVLLDLIITALLEESRISKITDEIKIILLKDKVHHINLKNHVRNWTDGK